MENISAVQDVLTQDQYRDLNNLLKQKKIHARLITPFSPLLFSQTEKCTLFEPLCSDADILELVLEVNQQIQKQFFKNLWKQFSKDAPLKIPKLLAPSILGFDLLKRAIALQLFATEPVHILFAGVPEIEKTTILRSVAAVHPISTYCSSTALQGQELLATALGDELEPGSLPRTDNGILCLEDIDCCPEADLAFLIQAMEKGVVFYSHAEQHNHFDAHVRVLATTKMLDALPVELVSHFHFIFSLQNPASLLLKKPDNEKQKPFLEAMEQEFLKSYICYAEQLSVQFPEIYQEQLATFVSPLQKKQKQGALSSLQVLLGMKRLAQARARMSLREKIIQEDITEVKTIVERSMAFSSHNI